MPAHQTPAPPAPKMNLPGLHENKGITYLSEAENKPARPSMIEAVRGLKSEAAIHGFVSLRGGACRRNGAIALRTRDRMLLMDRALPCILEHAFARAAAPPWPKVSMFLRSLCFGCTVLHRRSTSCRNKETNAKTSRLTLYPPTCRTTRMCPHMQCMRLNTMHRAHAIAKDGHLEPWESHIHERRRVRECNAMPDL
jgi:hypothetical protein